MPQDKTGNMNHPSSVSPTSLSTTDCYSKPHKVKGYADDLTLISSSANKYQHRSYWQMLYTEVCSNIRPEKCYSLVLGEGKKVPEVFKVANVTTCNIKGSISAFLGAIIGSNTSVTKNICQQKILDQFCSVLTRMDSSSVRGEHKVWMYQRYLVPSLHYHFSVNRFKNVTTKKMNVKAMKLVKSWLGFTKYATAAIFH